MTEKVKISTLAQKDLETSSKWYEEQRFGLGDEFAETIYKAIDSVLKNPLSYPSKSTHLREYLVRDYPFLIIYKYLPRKDLLVVTRIFHTSRNPKSKYNRR